MSGNQRRSDRLRERESSNRHSGQQSSRARPNPPSSPAGPSSPAPPTRRPVPVAPVVRSWDLPPAPSPYSLPPNPEGSFGVPRNPPGHDPGVQLPPISGRRRLGPLSEGNRHPYGQSQDARPRSGTPQSPGSASSRSQSGTPAPQVSLGELRPGRQIRPPPSMAPGDPTGAGPVRRLRSPPGRINPSQILGRRRDAPLHPSHGTGLDMWRPKPPRARNTK
jgi:hypothetical protein